MTIISGIDTEKLPTEVRNNPEKLGALLASAKLIELIEENEALKAEREFLLDQAATGVCSSQMVHNQVIANQSAVIDSILSDSSEQGMVWIRNGLFGPGNLIEVHNQVENKNTAQQYFNENEIAIKSHAEYRADVEKWLSEKVGE